MKKKKHPTYYFWLLEVSLQRGDSKTAEKARAELKRQGFNVNVQQSTPPMSQKGGSR